MTFVDYHNGPNLGLEPTTPMKEGEYLTLVFEKPISPAVRAIFAAQEWVAASHYDALQERDNYAREVAELRAEIERKDADVARMRRQLEWTEAYARDTLATNSRDMDDWRGDVEHIANSARTLLARYGAQPAAPQKAEPSDEHVSVVGMPEFDALLDHIYEYGTASEGIIDRANAFARALLSRYGRQQAESAEPAAQAPAADAHPGYAGVTVWVGDMKCTMTVPAPVLGASRCDALLECFQKARHAIDAAMQRTSGGDHADS